MSKYVCGYYRLNERHCIVNNKCVICKKGDKIMKALCIGSKGFVSSYLVKHLKKQGWEVSEFNLRDGQDIRNYEQVRNTVDAIRPDVIFHLAAMAAPAESFSNPARAIEVNTIGSLNVLESVRQLGLKTKIMLCSTSEVYGNEDPVEDGILKPRSPYAVSKAAMDYMGQLYIDAYGMEVIITRAFNHTGAGRGEMYAEAAFAKQIAQIEAGKRDSMEHGNLHSIRNFTDVRDIVRAYELAIKLPSGVYNICSDQNVSIEKVLDILAGLSIVQIKRHTNASLIRPADFSFQEPNCDKFKKLTGWEATISLDITLKEILDEWRSKV
jgi:GDP-4-dehydro-6-deoxy-D-mannose reductase